MTRVPSYYWSGGWVLFLVNGYSLQVLTALSEEFQDCSLNNEFGHKLETLRGELANTAWGIYGYVCDGWLRGALGIWGNHTYA